MNLIKTAGAFSVNFQVLGFVPATLVFKGLTGGALKINCGGSYQPFNDDSGAAVAPTGDGNLAITCPGEYQLTGTLGSGGSVDLYKL